MAYITFQPSDYFNTKLYTGNNSTNAVTGVGFQPDFVWLKPRNLADNHRLMNAVSGADKYLISNSTSGEGDPGSNFASFDSDGFTLGGSDSGWNNSSYNYVTWNWKANGSGSANTDGSISSTVSANTTSGFSIVKYTGNLTSGATIGHGLGVKPAMIIIKNLSASESWLCYHTSLGATKHIKLNATEAVGTATSRFNDTEPTTSVFTVGNDPQTNGNSNDMIAYCFAETKGFSKIGMYKGNGNANGTFVYTGFKPAFVLYRNYEIIESWMINDSKRFGYNPDNAFLFPNATQAESDIERIDLLSNGFKFKTTDNGQNGNRYDYIYMAFAEEPLVSSNNISSTAR